MSNEKYLIKNSTRQERAKRIKDGITVSMLDAKAPSKEAIILYQKYIDGEIEIEDVKAKLIEKYKKI